MTTRASTSPSQAHTVAVSGTSSTGPMPRSTSTGTRQVTAIDASTSAGP